MTAEARKLEDSIVGERSNGQIITCNCSFDVGGYLAVIFLPITTKLIGRLSRTPLLDIDRELSVV